MDLQSVFYIFAIIFMSLWLVILVLLSMVLWTVYDFVKNAPKRIESKIDATISEVVENSKSGIIGTVGITAGTFILNKIRDRFMKK